MKILEDIKNVNSEVIDKSKKKRINDWVENPLFVNHARLLPFTSEYWHNQLKEYLKPEFKNKSMLLPHKLEFIPTLKSDYNTLPYVIAIDTETYAKNGNLICLCNSENDSVLYGTVDKMPSISDIHEYLYALSRGNRETIFFAYNLKFDAMILLKSLNLDLEKFYNDEFEIETEDKVKIKYLNKKCLTIRKHRNTVIIFDALQFFLGAGKNEDGKSSSKLDDVARVYLGVQKKYEGKYQNKIFPDNIDKHELELIVEYCKLDCKLTKGIMKIWIENFKSSFGFYPDRYYSAGYLSVLVLRTRLNEFSTFRKIPFAVQDLAFRSYFGGRFEIMNKGLIENVYHYDIKSAYPHAMAEMPDFNRGRWKIIRSNEEFLKYSNRVGFYQIRVVVKDKNVAPFLFRGSHGQIVAPQGEFVTQVTSMELREAFSYYDIEVKKIFGYCFIPDNDEETEFNKLVKEMYSTRMKQTNDGQKYVYKVIINSIYGKTAQSKPEPKGIFSPVVCSYITGHTRAKLLNIGATNKENIIMFATDGIFSKKKLDLKVGKELGEFDFEFHPKFILLMAGVYFYNTEKEKDIQVRSRGFSLRMYESLEEDAKEIKFDPDEYELIQDGDRFYYKIINQRPIAISTALIQKKYNETVIGKMEKIQREIDINGDHKRNWFKNIRSVNDFSDSQTITLK